MSTWAIKKGEETVAILSGASVERGNHRSQWLVKDRDGKWIATVYTAIHMSVVQIGEGAPPAKNNSLASGELQNDS